MNIDDLVKAINGLSEIHPELLKAPPIQKTKEKLEEQLKRKGEKVISKDFMLESLVFLIEMLGYSHKQAFQLVSVKGSKHFTEPQARSLWFEVKENDLDKIEALRRSMAYLIVGSFMEWDGANEYSDFPSPAFGSLLEKREQTQYAATRLLNDKPELFCWALEKNVLDSLGEEYEEFDPDYKKPVDELLKDTFRRMSSVIKTSNS